MLIKHIRQVLRVHDRLLVDQRMVELEPQVHRLCQTGLVLRHCQKSKKQEHPVFEHRVRPAVRDRPYEKNDFEGEVLNRSRYEQRLTIGRDDPDKPQELERHEVRTDLRNDRGIPNQEPAPVHK